MVNIIIPVYNGTEFLPEALDSLVKQKQPKSDFIVTIVQDYDEQNYSEIIDVYRAKGLNIDFIKVEERIKQGRARQTAIDAHPESEYIMFLDQDDKYLPDTVELLYNQAKSSKADIVFSNYVKETIDDSEIVNQQHSEIITLLHGKIYSLDYITSNKIRFSDTLQYAEDSCFNLMAFYCTTKISYVDRVTYIWNYNEKSESNNNFDEYFNNMYSDYIKGQVEALLHIFEYAEEENYYKGVVVRILLYFYQICMILIEAKLPDESYKDSLKILGKEYFIKKLFEDKETLCFMASQVSGGATFKDEPLFFHTSYLDWVNTWLSK